MDHKNTNIVNAMTVDVEDYFQVSAFEDVISRDTWKNYLCRVETKTDEILQLFNTHNVKATFFTLGWVAQKFPNLIHRIVSEGHDLASHGYDHKKVSSLTREQFSEDVKRSKMILEDISAKKITGYRAPSYSFTKNNQWTHDVLHENGYKYSSSIAPIKHDLYGIPDAPRFPHLRAEKKILELPITTIRLLNKNYPCGGGGWFRLYPYRISKWAIDRVNNTDNKSAIFYFHPWELDPDQPRISGIDLTTRFRHYQNLKNMGNKISILLGDYHWRTIPEVYADELQKLN